MNESIPARGILLAHCSMAEGIVDAVRHITGAEEDVLVPLSNRGLSADALAERVRDLVGPGPTVLFTDLQHGSCGIAARLLTRDVHGVVVLSGVNLAMLLEFVMQRHLPIEELVPRLMEKGHQALRCSPATLEHHADRAAPRG